MARFRSQVSKGIKDQEQSNNQNMDARNHFLDNGFEDSSTNRPEPESVESTVGHKESGEEQILYSESDMELVNVAGFKVPYIVREHWKKECRKKRVKLSPMLKKILADEFGLPSGITIEDL